MKPDTASKSDVKFGYFAAHEQYDPVTLLEFAAAASKQGFDTIWSSDHFQPWFHTGGHAGFAWVWLAALGERTKGTKFGTAATVPIRYRPAIVAQAFATLAVMYGDRVFVALGSGEALNEVPAGAIWPRFAHRAGMVEEACHIMRQLWAGEVVNFQGSHFQIKQARLYTRPRKPIPLYIASHGPALAKLAGRIADGYLTLPVGKRHIQDVLLPEVEKGAREVGRDPSEIEKVIEIEVSFDDDYEKAVKGCRRWAGTLVPGSVNMIDPQQIENEGRRISRERLTQTWVIATSPEHIIKATEDYLHMGFRHVQFLSASPDENRFIDVVSRKVLRYLRDSWK